MNRVNDTYEIIMRNGRYVLPINNQVYKSYGTFAEAVRAMETIKAEKEGLE